MGRRGRAVGTRQGLALCAGSLKVGSYQEFISRKGLIVTTQGPEHPEGHAELPPEDLPPQTRGRRPKLTELDYEADPLARLERNNRSTKQAIIYFFAIPGTAAAIALITAIVSRMVGGPFCDADSSAWLCTQGFRLFFHIVPAVVCFFGLFGAAYICYYKWKRRQRWRPWIAVIWFLMPIAIGWSVNSTAMLMLGA